MTSPSSLCLSREGVVVASYPSHHLAVFTVNGKRLRNELHSDNIQVFTLRRKKLQEDKENKNLG